MEAPFDQSDGAQRPQIIIFRFAANCRLLCESTRVRGRSESTTIFCLHADSQLLDTRTTIGAIHSLHPSRVNASANRSRHFCEERVSGKNVSVSVTRYHRGSHHNLLSQPQPRGWPLRIFLPRIQCPKVTVCRHEPGLQPIQPLNDKANNRGT